jgi:hypothetical protein
VWPHDARVKLICVVGKLDLRSVPICIIIISPEVEFVLLHTPSPLPSPVASAAFLAAGTSPLDRSLGMPRAARLSGQLPSPPKSFDGSESSSETSHRGQDINKRNNRKTPRKPGHDEPPLTPSSENSSRILRRQSTRNVSAEIRAFFVISALPSGQHKNDILLTAIDSVSEFWEGPSPKDLERMGERSKDDSDLPRSTLDPSTESPLKKQWLTSGLYARSTTSADHSQILGKSRKSDPGPGAAAQKRFKFTLPIFSGKDLMETERDFKLPWNLYATDGQKCKPPPWSRIKRSKHPTPPLVFEGMAAHWEKKPQMSMSTLILTTIEKSNAQSVFVVLNVTSLVSTAPCFTNAMIKLVV